MQSGPFSRGALEWILATPGHKDASVRKNRHDAEIVLRRTAWGAKSLVDILSPSFGDANVATQPNQSDRGDRGRQGKDKPHPPGISRTVCGAKGS